MPRREVAGVVRREERRWVWAFGFLVVALTTWPYLVAWLHQGVDWRFSGFVFGVEDGNSYIAKMMAGASGAWLYRSPYTAQAMRPILVYLPYLWLGKLVGPSHDCLVLLFHLFRGVAGMALVHAVYDFLALFVDEVGVRRWGTALIVLGGGLGWLLIPWGHLPLAFYSPEAFGFLALYGLPHLTLARALLLWGWRALLHDRPRLGGLFWLGCGLMQPITLAVGWAVLGAWACVTRFWRERARVRRLLVFLGFSAPLLGYTVLSQWLDPFFRVWAAQNVLPAPPFWVYLLAYGALLPWAWPGTKALLRERPHEGWLPVLWVVVGLGLTALPVSIQRRLLDGVWVALVALAAGRMSSRGRVWATMPLWVSSALLILMGVQAARHPAEPVFLPAAEVRAFQAVADHAPKGAVVLTTYPTGNALPAWAPVRVVLGHGVETAHVNRVREDVATFFRATTSDAWRRDFLRAFGVQYLLVGPRERQAGGFDPAAGTDFSLLWQQDGYALWAFEK